MAQTVLEEKGQDVGGETCASGRRGLQLAWDPGEVAGCRGLSVLTREGRRRASPFRLSSRNERLPWGAGLGPPTHPWPLCLPDAASKHAALGFFDCLRAEVEEYDVVVSTVSPTFVRSYRVGPGQGSWEASIWKCELSGKLGPGRAWGALGGPGGFWGALGGFWEGLGGSGGFWEGLGHSGGLWGVLGGSGRALGGLWGLWEGSGEGFFGALGGLREALGGLLGGFWGVRGALGRFLGALGGFWGGSRRAPGGALGRLLGGGLWGSLISPGLGGGGCS